MKHIEKIDQKIFIRDNSGLEYDVILHGNAEIICDTCFNSIHVCRFGQSDEDIDIIDLDDIEFNNDGIFGRTYREYDISIIIIKRTK